ncbi:MAG: MBOAT family protein, partial [Bacteroidetes bacterium]|nr:MBOAT family protein [Bacteroidota bacterium]
YVFDIYRRRIKPTENFLSYAVFVGFFPLLVAGPIERATHLLPQVEKPRHFDAAKATDGLRQMLWGFFKKMVIADGCGEYADWCFLHVQNHSGSTLLLGAVMFAVQIYGDFSGYSDIAIGTGRLFGFDIIRNFAYPYFSRDIAEFWRRWHISLTSWFRDYLYIPMGGSAGSKAQTIRNIFIVFLVSGFWHGAKWTFLSWGLLNALFFLPLLLRNKNRQHLQIVAQGRQIPSLKEGLDITITFALTVFAWIFFRAPDLPQAFDYISHLFSRSLLELPARIPYLLLVIVFVFFIIEWMGREQEYAIARFGLAWPALFRWGFYYLLIIAIFLIGPKTQQFIYFQF